MRADLFRPCAVCAVVFNAKCRGRGAFRNCPQHRGAAARAARRSVAEKDTIRCQQRAYTDSRRHPCAQCGITRVLWQSTLCRACELANRTTARMARTQFTCRGCGQVLARGTRRTAHDAKMFCSRQCAFAHRVLWRPSNWRPDPPGAHSRIYPGRCRLCQMWFIGTKKTGRILCRLCAECRRHEDAHRQYLLHQRGTILGEIEASLTGDNAATVRAIRRRGGRFHALTEDQYVAVTRSWLREHAGDVLSRPGDIESFEFDAGN